MDFSKVIHASLFFATFMPYHVLRSLRILCSLKITTFAPAVFPIIVQPASQSHGNSLLRCYFSLVWNKFLHRWTIQRLRITLLTINRDKEIQLRFSHGIPLSLDTSVKMHTLEPEWSFCLIVSLSTCGSFCQNYLISWHLQKYILIYAF